MLTPRPVQDWHRHNPVDDKGNRASQDFLEWADTIVQALGGAGRNAAVDAEDDAATAQAGVEATDASLQATNSNVTALTLRVGQNETGIINADAKAQTALNRANTNAAAIDTLVTVTIPAIETRLTDIETRLTNAGI